MNHHQRHPSRPRILRRPTDEHGENRQGPIFIIAGTRDKLSYLGLCLKRVPRLCEAIFIFNNRRVEATGNNFDFTAAVTYTSHVLASFLTISTGFKLEPI
ncbi:uncharacterized protein LAJ45_03947 [Morchella importuna]|uniref:uncharacterized protein n=1 Tax=Morchella importuna TaxID=1174673 RepID=UPI001E8D2EB2|nr:uncharacterized protein LAJ45_03947 [Morchella importuna]KAH8151954.1 hypothetical protein LAJ45_03947 [Morchella importuna]